MRSSRVFKRLLGVEHTVIESVELVEDERRGEEMIHRSSAADRLARVVLFSL